nr:amino acid ABC transporter permease [Lachnospiraceae bacterium]
MESFINKFYQNFIEDNRWMFLVEGLKNTLIIAFVAILIGVVLGFLIAIIRSLHDKFGNSKLLSVLNFICRIYLTIMRGTPVVVQLLIMYYVVFVSPDASKILTACITFGLNSAAYVAEIMRSGIMAVNQGQFEAGMSLGLSVHQIMIRIIIPQAFKNVLPALANEFIVLVKETSISGYVAIVDLTKGGDIIRSTTYSAFMPLFAVALIYLAVTMVLSALV